MTARLSLNQFEIIDMVIIGENNKSCVKPISEYQCAGFDDEIMEVFQILTTKFNEISRFKFNWFKSLIIMFYLKIILQSVYRIVNIVKFQP